jgi:UDP-N-acetyl-D-mannosaminuronate dehydrogenase
MIPAAGDVNAGMPEFVVQKLERLLAGRGKALAQTRVLLLGIAYKPDMSDVRESPAFPMLALLQRRGACVTYYDPHVPTARWEDSILCSLTASELADERFDCAVLLTDHTGIDYAALVRRVDVFLDTRGRLSSVESGTIARL